QLERVNETRLDLRDDLRRETLRGQSLVVDSWCAAESLVADRVTNDRFDLLFVIAELSKRRRDRLIDDLEIAAAGEFLELDEREVRLDAGRVAVHDQPDRAGR